MSSDDTYKSRKFSKGILDGDYIKLEAVESENVKESRRSRVKLVLR